MPVFKVKQGDTRPTMQANLRDARKRPLPLSGAAVRFKMRPKEGTSGQVVNGAATILDTALALVEYRWTPDDTNAPGVYDAEFEVTFADGTVSSVPNNGFIDVVVIPDLDSHARQLTRRVGVADTGASVS